MSLCLAFFKCTRRKKTGLVPSGKQVCHAGGRFWASGQHGAGMGVFLVSASQAAVGRLPDTEIRDCLAMRS